MLYFVTMLVRDEKPDDIYVAPCDKLGGLWYIWEFVCILRGFFAVFDRGLRMIHEREQRRVLYIIKQNKNTIKVRMFHYHIRTLRGV